MGRSHASSVIVKAAFAHPWATAESKVNAPARAGGLQRSIAWKSQGCVLVNVKEEITKEQSTVTQSGGKAAVVLSQTKCF